MKDFAFTGGRPDPGTFPTEQLIEASAKALRRIGGDLVNYPGENGNQSLRELASKRFERREGVALPIDDISLTSGSMQSLELILRTFVKPGDTVLTEELVYSGTLGLLRYLEADIVGVPVDYVEGMDMTALEQQLEKLKTDGKTPKLIYVTVNHQNPTGAILTLERRKRLLELADQFDLLINEDDCYGAIDFIPNATPDALYKLDRSDRVIYIATFSKILGAGVRQGYFVTSAHYRQQIHRGRWDAGTSGLASVIVAQFFNDHLDEHLAITNAVVKAKCQAVIDTLSANASDLCTWTTPRGGLFLWIGLPQRTDLDKLQKLAGRKSVGFSRGSAFHCRNEPIKSIRLAYAYCALDDIEEGITYLCHAIRDAQS